MAKENYLRTEKALKINDRWEYLVIRSSTSVTSSLNTGQEQMNKLGREGWELVSMTTAGQLDAVSGQMTTLIMAFKRKLPS